MHGRLLAVALVIGSSIGARADAQTFSIDPVLVEIPADARSGLLRIGNDGTSEIVVQLRGFAWHQVADGPDQFDPAPDLVIGPPVVRVPPKGSQIVRLLLRTPATAEVAYRILADRLNDPNDHAAGTQSGIRMRVNLSLPLFVGTPRNARADPVWSLRPDGAGGGTLIVRNQGTTRMRIEALSLVENGREVPIPGNGSRYVLTASERRWAIPRGASIASDQPVVVRVTSDAVVQEATIRPTGQ
jgi:fimbrial chaperone protein